MWAALTGRSSSRSSPPPSLTSEEKNFLDKFTNSYYDAYGDFDSTKKIFLDVTTENKKILGPMCYEIEKNNQVRSYLQKKFSNEISKKIHNELCVKYNELVKQEAISSQQQRLDKENKKTEKLYRHLQQSIKANMGCESLDYFIDHQAECKKQKDDAYKKQKEDRDDDSQLDMLYDESLGASEHQIYDFMKHRNDGVTNTNERSTYIENPMFAKTTGPGLALVSASSFGDGTRRLNQLGARLVRRKKSRNPRKNTKKSRKSRKNAKKYRKNSRK